MSDMLGGGTPSVKSRAVIFGIGRRELLIGAAGVAAAGLMPKGALAQAKPRSGGTLRVAMPYNPAAIDPMTGRNLPDFNTLFALYDALIDFDPDSLALKPGLAKSWRWTDDKTLVLQLRDGVKFHDGTDFDAEAARFNIERYRTDKRSVVIADLKPLASVAATGKMEITIKLNQPYAPLPTVLTDRAGLMVSPTSIKNAKDGNVDRQGVGTGPFKFVSWQDNEKIAMVKNPGYWKKGLPYLDALELDIISEPTTVLRSTVAGETDMCLNLTTDLTPQAKQAQNIKWENDPSAVFFGMFINYAKKPTDDVRVRQALAWAVDRDELVTVLGGGYGDAGSGVLPKQMWGTDQALFNYYKTDTAKAKALLAEAGYPNGIDLDSYGWPDQISVKRTELVTAQLAKAGIRLHNTALSPVELITAFDVKKMGHLTIGPVSGRPDPSQEYEALFAKTALYNAGGEETPELRKLLDASVADNDVAKRKVALQAVQKYVTEQALYVTFYFSYGLWARSPRVQNFRFGLLERPKFNEVWMEA